MTNGPKWTPGPWRYGAVAGGWDGVYEPGGAVICVLSLNEPANALLIAAATELATVAQRLCMQLMQAGVDAVPDSNDPLESLHAQALAALVKARGGMVTADRRETGAPPDVDLLPICANCIHGGPVGYRRIRCVLDSAEHDMADGCSYFGCAAVPVAGTPVVKHGHPLDDYHAEVVVPICDAALKKADDFAWALLPSPVAGSAAPDLTDFHGNGPAPFKPVVGRPLAPVAVAGSASFSEAVMSHELAAERAGASTYRNDPHETWRPLVDAEEAARARVESLHRDEVERERLASTESETERKGLRRRLDDAQKALGAIWHHDGSDCLHASVTDCLFYCNETAGQAMGAAPNPYRVPQTAEANKRHIHDRLYCKTCDEVQSRLDTAEDRAEAAEAREAEAREALRAIVRAWDNGQEDDLYVAVKAARALAALPVPSAKEK